VYLLPQEVAALKKYFTSEYLNPIHRLPLAYFLTSCYTGMRISDLQAYKDQLPKNIISFDQVKTDNSQFMKLNKEIRTLLESVPEFFTDSLSDQKINKHLKTIGTICKIEKNITMHVGRHTFATTYVRNNGNVFKLKNLLGHDDIKTTMQYVHLIENEEMEGLDDLITY
jgi:integrase